MSMPLQCCELKRSNFKIISDIYYTLNLAKYYQSCPIIIIFWTETSCKHSVMKYFYSTTTPCATQPTEKRPGKQTRGKENTAHASLSSVWLGSSGLQTARPSPQMSRLKINRTLAVEKTVTWSRQRGTLWKSSARLCKNVHLFVVARARMAETNPEVHQLLRHWGCEDCRYAVNL